MSKEELIEYIEKIQKIQLTKDEICLIKSLIKKTIFFAEDDGNIIIDKLNGMEEMLNDKSR
jgi:hypothetical protein